MKGWHRGKVSSDAEQHKSPTSYAANTSKVKDRIHAFQRDFDQNNADAGIHQIDSDYPRPPEANYEVKRLTGQEKTGLLEGIGYFEEDDTGHSLADYIEKHRKDHSNERITSKEKMQDPDHPLTILICENDHSVGLIGAEGSYDLKIRPEEFGDMTHNLKALVRDLGESQKSGGTGMGTYGFGKEVSYEHSRARLVLYYSSLRVPYQNKFASHPDKEITRRLIGVNWLEADIDMGMGPKRMHKSHFGVKEDLDFLGHGYEGETSVRSLYNDEADAAAEGMGLRIRSPEDHGTTILIIDFFDYDDSEQQDPKSLLKRILRSQEEYYYPKLHDDELSCSAIIDGEKTHPNPEENDAAANFVDAYRMTLLNGEGEGFHVKEFDLKIPANPSEGFAEDRTSKVVMGIKFTDSTESEPAEANLTKPRPNTLAWIRGAGMAVTHESFKIGSLAKEFHGIILCGEVVSKLDWVEGLDPAAQTQAERLLSYAENVSHDEISASSKREEFTSWKGAKQAIYRLRRMVRRILRETVAAQSDSPTGRAAPRFNLSFGTEGTKSKKRVLSIQDLSVEKDEPEQSWYLSTFRVILPPSGNKDLVTDPGAEEPEYYTGWRIEVPCQFVEEDGAVIRDRIPGSIVTVRVEEDGIEIKSGGDDYRYSDESTDTPWIEGEFTDSWRTVFIDIETDEIDVYHASYGRVRAKPTAKLGTEVLTE